MYQYNRYKHKRLKTVEYIVRLSNRIGDPKDFEELWGWSDEKLIAYRKIHDDGGYYAALKNHEDKYGGGDSK